MKLLNAKEAASFLRIAKATVYQWAREGFIPHYEVGRKVLFEEGALLKWLDERRQAGRTRRIAHNRSRTQQAELTS